MKLTGKVVIVTGGSSGIGAGIARALGVQGAVVIENYTASKDGARVTRPHQGSGRYTISS